MSGYQSNLTMMRKMRKGAPHSLILGNRMVKSSRDEPSRLINLATSPSICSGLHNASTVRIVDMSITVCGPRSQRMSIGLSEYKYSRRHGDRFCNSTALTSSSTVQISSGLYPKPCCKNTDRERRFKGGQRRREKCSIFAI